MTIQSDDHYFVITSNSTIITSLCTAQVSGYTGMFIGCNSTKLKFRTWTSFIMTGNFWYNCKKERELVISTSCALHLINFDLIFKRFRSYDISITSIFAETLAYLVYAKKLYSPVTTAVCHA